MDCEAAQPSRHPVQLRQCDRGPARADVAAGAARDALGRAGVPRLARPSRSTARLRRALARRHPDRRHPAGLRRVAGRRDRCDVLVVPGHPAVTAGHPVHRAACRAAGDRRQHDRHVHLRRPVVPDAHPHPAVALAHAAAARGSARPSQRRVCSSGCRRSRRTWRARHREGAAPLRHPRAAAGTGAAGCGVARDRRSRAGHPCRRLERARAVRGTVGERRGPSRGLRQQRRARVAGSAARDRDAHARGCARRGDPRQRGCCWSRTPGGCQVPGHGPAGVRPQSHPWDSVSPGGLRLLNPGSPTDRRRQPHATMLWAEFEDGALVATELVEL